MPAEILPKKSKMDKPVAVVHYESSVPQDL